MAAELDYNGMIYFFGGNVNGINANKIFFYNFERRIIENEEEIELTWYESFRENKLHPMWEKLYSFWIINISGFRLLFKNKINFNKYFIKFEFKSIFKIN